MTKNQILAMKPGPGMDLMVTDRVMHRSNVKEYSTYMSATKEIMERLKISVIHSEDGWYAVVTDDVIHSDAIQRYTYEYKQVYGKHWALADNVPEAICKAALCAVLAKEEN